MSQETSQKLDKISADVAAINVTLAKQEATLSDHIRRTALAEEALTRHDARLRPLETAAAVWGVLGKVIATLAAGTALVLGVMKLLGA